jgi:prepilin-type N-terminal cleavage/methylation domain-containing protein
MTGAQSLLLSMPSANNKTSHIRSGFTLIELLTVIAIIAVLASLLLTALVSGKKNARTMICTSNLHQFGVALELYMDDSSGKRPAVGDLVGGKYLLAPQNLICPEDKTGNWGQWVETGGALVPINNAGSVNYSYLLQPLTWNNAEWSVLMAAGSKAGVAACQLHGLGNQNTPDIRNYSGLLLRVNLTGPSDGNSSSGISLWLVIPVRPAHPALVPALQASLIRSKYFSTILLTGRVINNTNGELKFSKIPAI